MSVKKIMLIVLLIFTMNQAIIASESLDYLNRILQGNEGESEKSGKRLSEGTYLLPDNPANHAIYEKLEAHIRELETVIRNNGDLISYYRTAEGYLNEITELLQTIRELLIKRSNTIYSNEDREFIDAEIHLYFEQILFALRNAEFNKQKIFIELLQDDSITERFRQEDYFSIGKVDTLLGFFTSQRVTYGALMNTLELRNQGMGASADNMSDFRSSLWHIDMAAETSRLTKYHLLFLINLLLLRDDTG